MQYIIIILKLRAVISLCRNYSSYSYNNRDRLIVIDGELLLEGYSVPIN